MESNVAGQGSILGGGSGHRSLFPETSFADISTGRLRIDKGALSRQVQAVHGLSADDDGFLIRLIEKIKAFLRRLFSVFFAPRNSGAEPQERSGYSAGINPASGFGGNAPSGGLHENDEAIVAEGLPQGALDRAQQVIEGLVQSALGGRLTPSLKAAMAMPEIERKPALRVLLQQNLLDTQTLRETRAELSAHAERLLAPFAAVHDLDGAVALKLFQADLVHGGGLIAERVEARSELRRYAAELSRLDSSLSALAQARGVICEHALSVGAYSRDELAALIEAQGHDASFLAPGGAAKEVDHVPTYEAGEVAGTSAANVVSLKDFRGRAAREGNVQDEEGRRAEVAQSPHAASVSNAIASLVEQGVLDRSNGDVSELEASMAMDDTFAAEDEFVGESSGDDLSSFLKKDSRTHTSPKP